MTTHRAGPRPEAHVSTGRASWLPGALARLLPEGRALPEVVWRARHRIVTSVGAVQAVALFALALGRGLSPGHGLAEAAIVAVPILGAMQAAFSRHVRAAFATAALVAASGVFVHLADGVTEAHFHFFVMIALVALYQDWVPYLTAIALTVLHHGLFGTIDPESVYGTPAAWRAPWLWAAVHGGFVLAASAASLAAWRLNEDQALSDPLTGVANRTRFNEALVRALAADDRPVSVVFLDVDDFKAINDAHGHAAGDVVLCEVAERLRTAARASDVVARFGGDEFAVLVLGDLRAAHAVAERFEHGVRAAVHHGGSVLHVSASIGVAATEPGESRAAADLVRHADLAMYLAKAQGKDRSVVFSSSMHDAALTASEIRRDLDRVVETDELHLRYQPLVDLETGRVAGVEALVRWQHPVLGEVPPSTFVPMAEDTGAIVAIGAWVLDRALQDMVRLAAEQTLLAPLPVSVNLSPRQLHDADIVSLVRERLESTGYPAGLLTLEVTESALIRDLTRASVQLVGLRSLGVRIAIDDFGTGYSSLSYLRQLPADAIKIDRSFVAAMASDDRATALVGTIVQLGRALSLDIVAEGIETAEQADALRMLRCRKGQGFHFSLPTTIDALAGVIAGLSGAGRGVATGEIDRSITRG